MRVIHDEPVEEILDCSSNPSITNDDFAQKLRAEGASGAADDISCDDQLRPPRLEWCDEYTSG